MTTYDLLAIGGGAGGLAAARGAALFGARAAMVVDGPIGGDCTWTGCVPSKTLIEAARRGDGFAEAMTNVHRVVGEIAATEDAETLRAEGVDVIEGRGRLVGDGRVDVDGVVHTASTIAIATGGRAIVPPIPGLDLVRYRTNEDFWELAERPARVAVIGGGPIGCELAQAMAGLGVQVTLFELLDRVLSRNEPEASEIVERALAQAGVDVRVGTGVDEVGPAGGGAIEVRAGGTTVVVDELLLAIGRRPNTEDLGLEAAGVTLTEQGHIDVDKRLKTAADGVYAVGDVNGLMPFTHAADEQGRIVGWRAAGKRVWTFNPARVPAVTFTAPEVASVGVTEADAPRGAKVAYLPMAQNDRAIAAGDTDGFIKIIAGKRRVLGHAGGGKVLGATIVGPRAGEMIHEPALMMLTNSFTGRLGQLAHAYPTWSVGIQKAVGQFFREVDGRSARTIR